MKIALPSSLRIDTYPYALLASFYVVLGSLLLYIPPSLGYRRLSLIPIIFYTVFTLLHAETSYVGIDGSLFFGHCIIGLLLYGHYWLCIIRVCPKKDESDAGIDLSTLDLEAEKVEPTPLSLTQKLKWSYKVLANPRGIGTEWQCRNLPVFSTRDPGWAPSRSRFILTQILTCILFYAASLLYDKTVSYIPWERGDLSPVKASFFRRLPDVTGRELLIRVFFPINTFLPQYCLYRCFHSLVGAIFVAVGDAPADWAPLFGDLRHAYSMRGFWGKFWHLLYYRGFVANASFIAHDILRLPKKTQFARCVIVTLVFGLSALVHITGDKMMSSGCKAVPLYLWYFIQSQMIVAEVLIEVAWNHVTKYWTSPVWKSTWWRVLGYVWVLAAFGWSIPKMQLPNTQCTWKAA